MEWQAVFIALNLVTLAASTVAIWFNIKTIRFTSASPVSSTEEHAN